MLYFLSFLIINSICPWAVVVRIVEPGVAGAMVAMAVVVVATAEPGVAVVVVATAEPGVVAVAVVAAEPRATAVVVATLAFLF